jgi:thiol-disulfide isomerase/thioredoxin
MSTTEPHAFNDGDTVLFEGVLPTSIKANTPYIARNVSGTDFEISVSTTKSEIIHFVTPPPRPKIIEVSEQRHFQEVTNLSQTSRRSNAAQNAEWLTRLFGSTIIGPGGQQLSVTCLHGKIVGIYFSAHWCPPCRAFTPQLADKYRELVGAGKNFDIVFVSSDKSEQEMKDYFGQMPWKALPFSSSKKQELAAKYDAASLPTLVLLDTLGNTITLDGRNAVISEPFPFGKVVSARAFDAATVVLFYSPSEASRAASECFDSLAQLAGAPTDGITFCKVNKSSNAVPQDLKSAPQNSWVCSQPFYSTYDHIVVWF